MNLLTRQVWVGDRLVELAREFLLAEMFLRHPMQVMTESNCLIVWGYDYDPG